ncbi:HAD-like domain-containing protein [Microdochium trichocladiopsis]|uniref:HAD-like domain-containing protein n=1 Tax=Microdochium trichocladiopsis TaxID=1682393 RepID=A0A9P9BJR6_9PEZI|nr:HAD-like domain-containing protein [Microdochium trichocladiopsis]KAH7025854.1 HAD-like domain-containing protein [Microdochium trichocladiopsis]
MPSPSDSAAGAAPQAPAGLSQVRALTFDVFGTVVDWRTTVVRELTQAARDKLATLSSSSSSAGTVAAATAATAATIIPDGGSSGGRYKSRLEALTDQDWAAFAQEWRNSYGVFTRSFVPGVTPWKDIDAHHRDSLVELLVAWGLGGDGDDDDDDDKNNSTSAGTPAASTVYTSAELEHLSRVWHRLDPWPDSAAGLHALGGGFITATLSNGTRELLQDLDAHGGLGFREIISTADFGAYKPHPSTYLGAVKKLVGSGGGGGVAKGEEEEGKGEGGDRGDPGQVAMVAAHLGDLAAARSHGLRTIYVERPREEAWAAGEERYQDARRWVDIWVAEGEGGFLEVARRLGVPVSSAVVAAAAAGPSPS